MVDTSPRGLIENYRNTTTRLVMLTGVCEANQFYIEICRFANNINIVLDGKKEFEQKRVFFF